ncbi:MAG: P-loop NTPase [Deltaproteobacteria bacterium]|nr:P-loop NTPase [Deltaproteobacteria bacterium]
MYRTQASGLTELREARVIPLHVNRRRFIAITGAKGGIGKSTLSVNLAFTYARWRSRTIIVDGDVGMADLNLMLGVAPERSLADVAKGEPVEACVAESNGLYLLPGLNGSYALANADSAMQGRIMAAVGQLKENFETVLIDAPAGIERNAVELTAEADDIVAVVTPQPTSIADAYGCLKVLHQRWDVDHVFLLVNDVRSDAQGQETVEQMVALTSRFIPKLGVTPLPFVPHDSSLPHYAAQGLPAVLAAPDAPASRAIQKVARTLDLMAQGGAAEEGGA